MISSMVIRGNATFGVTMDPAPDLSHVVWDKSLTVSLVDHYPDEQPYISITMDGVDCAEQGARRPVFRETTVSMPGSNETIDHQLRIVMATIMVEAIAHGTDRDCCPYRNTHPVSWNTVRTVRRWTFVATDSDALHDRICADLRGAVEEDAETWLDECGCDICHDLHGWVDRDVR